MSEATKSEAKKPEAATPDIGTIQSMNIFQRVAAITDELGVVAKKLSVSAGKGGSYKAVSERDIIDAVKPLEVKYRVYSYPSDREIIDDEILEGEKTYNSQTTKTTTFFTRIKTEYTFLNIDKPDERFTTIVYSEGIDPGDKGSGKAMTYADKYALMKAYKISTGDDPDQNASEEINYQRSGNRGNQGGYGGNQGQSQGNNWDQNQGQNRNQYQGQNNRPQGNGNSGKAGMDIRKCGNCGNPIQDAFGPDGKVVPAGDVAFNALQRWGVPYCADCQNKLMNMRGNQR